MQFLLNFWFIFTGILALGICVFIHELGHYIAAKKRGLIADRFSIGFGPRLFGWHHKAPLSHLLLPLAMFPSSARRYGTTRRRKTLQRPSPITYTDKMVVAVMGAVFNLIFAFLITLVLWGVGREVIKSTTIGSVAQTIVNSDGITVPSPTPSRTPKWRHHSIC